MPLTPLDSVAATELANGSILASLVSALHRKGLLSEEEVREVYETALLLLEEQQGTQPEIADIFDAARELIEQHLRPGEV